MRNNILHPGCWMPCRRYFVKAELTDLRPVEALAFIRTVYAVERCLKNERRPLGDRFPDADAERWRQPRAGPIPPRFADWLDVQTRTATPKSLFGQAVGYARNPLPSLVRYLADGRFAIDNGAAEQAIRPIAVGRPNWLRIGGDGGLPTASVLLSVCATARRNRLHPWAYLTDLPARRAGAVLDDLLPDG